MTVVGEGIPFRARLPWFGIWVPLALFIYVVINGVGYFSTFFRLMGITEWLPLHAYYLLKFRQVLCGPWGLLIWPTLVILACSTWHLVPQCSPFGIMVYKIISLFILLLLVLAQLSLLIPFGSDIGWMPSDLLPLKWSSGSVRFVLTQTWTPHFSYPTTKEEVSWPS